MSRYLVKIKDSSGVVHEKELQGSTLNSVIEEYIQELMKEDPELFLTNIDFSYIE
jgi:hypothetical protein